jgi:hypothetical protein
MVMILVKSLHSTVLSLYCISVLIEAIKKLLLKNILTIGSK